MRNLTIITDGEKGRSFHAVLLSYCTGRQLWEGGQHDNVRPIWAMIACSEAESTPFMANLRAGRKANIHGEEKSRSKSDAFELLKSAGYEYHAQRHAEGIVWTVFLPELYRIDPGMVDPEGVKFAMLPDSKWLAPVDELTAQILAEKYWEDLKWSAERQRERDAEMLDIMRYVTMVATLFCAYLDRRTRCPLIPDPKFYSRVLAACLNAGIASLGEPGGYHSSQKWGRCGCGYEEVDCSAAGVACSTSHDRLEALLAECVRDYEG